MRAAPCQPCRSTPPARSGPCVAVPRCRGPAVALATFAAWCAAPTDELTAVPFEELVADLNNWLDIQSDGDEAEKEQIQTLRDERHTRIDAVSRRIANNMDLADTARTNAKNDIKRKLGDVQKQLREMWLRAGRAEINLHITHTEPSSPDEPLTCQAAVHTESRP
jgi:hypothetical protein